MSSEISTPRVVFIPYLLARPLSRLARTRFASTDLNVHLAVQSSMQDTSSNGNNTTLTRTEA